MLLLAHAHHRSLTGLPEELSAPAATELAQEPPALSPSLGELLQTLSQLPAQIAALQQQLSALIQWLQQPPAGPALPTCPGLDGAGGGSEPPTAKASAKSRPAASSSTKRPRAQAHVLPLVESASEGHYVVLCPKQGLLPLEPESPEWFAWLASLSSFRFVGKYGRLTAHREVQRVSGAAWPAHRQIRNHTYNLHLAPTESLTIAVLEQAAATLQAHLK